jgi:hypothetical protein
MTTKFEVRDLNNNVIIATNNVKIYNYCISAFNVIKQVADRTNYIITDGYKYSDMKEIIEKNINEMLNREN